jgi:hypothetical protein
MQMNKVMTEKQEKQEKEEVIDNCVVAHRSKTSESARTKGERTDFWP